MCALAAALGLTTLLPGLGRAEDLDITISPQAIERLFTAAQPIKFKADLVAGQGADVALSNPKITLEPGQPGRVWVDLDYEIETAFLGLPGLSGRVKPEVRFKFDPARGAMQVTLHNLLIKGIPVDGLVEPTYLPLTSTEPIKLKDKQIKVEAAAARTEVTKEGLRVLLNYQFTPAPLQ
ncbi:MAG: hypothetical protein AB1896_11745 [Thermodesulfobacteriota bacterium]